MTRDRDPIRTTRRAALVLLAACGMDADGQPSGLPEGVRAVQNRMHERFAPVQRIEQGVVTGRIGEVRAGARTIATLEDPEILPTWQPYLDAVREAAREIEAADNVIAAARRTGELGRQCARCHLAAGSRVVFRGVPKPDQGERLHDTMAGHQWAAARMWEGLIAPSDERWTAGALALQRAPLTLTAESGALGIADDVALVRDFARQATTMRGQIDRAQLFGQLLATCAHCHATIRDGSYPPPR